MTGSAFKAMDVVVGCLSSEKGGGLEEGGLEIHPERRLADLFSALFFVFFFTVPSGAPLGELVPPFGRQGSSK